MGWHWLVVVLRNVPLGHCFGLSSHLEVVKL